MLNHNKTANGGLVFSYSIFSYQKLLSFLFVCSLPVPEPPDFLRHEQLIRWHALENKADKSASNSLYIKKEAVIHGFQVFL